MSEHDTPSRRAGVMRVARSRGAVTGPLLVLLGIWGAIIPFVGPLFNFAYTPDNAWTWTSGRWWLEILPGLATIVGGFLMAMTANRAVGVFAGYLASAAGAWFVVGPVLGQLWSGPEGAIGTPTGSGTVQVLEQLFFFYGLGALILFLAAHALGRFTVRSVRDVRASERHSEERRDERLRAEGRREEASREESFPVANTGRSDVNLRENTVAAAGEPVVEPSASAGATRAAERGRDSSR